MAWRERERGHLFLVGVLIDSLEEMWGVTIFLVGVSIDGLGEMREATVLLVSVLVDDLGGV